MLRVDGRLFVIFYLLEVYVFSLIVVEDFFLVRSGFLSCAVSVRALARLFSCLGIAVESIRWLDAEQGTEYASDDRSPHHQ